MKKRILVVDDDDKILDILYKILTKEGFEVKIAIDGKTAIESARKFVPDLLLLDVQMPEMDGGDVVANIHNDEELKSVPVVFLTGQISQDESVMLNEGSPDSPYRYLSKSSDIKVLVDSIKQILDIQQL